jgi:4-aminobutyrate aminotransferase-like enzyme
MTTAKALGNGLPIGAFITSDTFSQSYTRPGASTTGGNPVSATAGLSVLEYMRTNNLAQRADELGKYLKERLLMIKQKAPLIGDVRGLGLMIGAELVQDNKTPAPAELTDLILEKMKDEGFLIGKTGADRNVLTFMPPLIITQHDIDMMCDVLERVITNY